MNWKNLTTICFVCLVVGFLSGVVVIGNYYKEANSKRIDLLDSIRVLNNDIDDIEWLFTTEKNTAKYYKQQAKTSDHLLRNSLKAIERLRKIKNEKIVITDTLTISELYKLFIKFNKIQNNDSS